MDSMKQLILVVDGDASCRGALRTTLQASGYDVAVLYNASKVVRRVEAERPTLMVMAGGASSGEAQSHFSWRTGPACAERVRNPRAEP